MGEIALGLALGLGIGLTLAVMGAGGSILTVPALVFVGDLSVQEATGTALLVVAGAAGVGALTQYRAGRAQLNIAIPLGVAGIGGAILGAWLHDQADEDLVLFLLSFLILVTAGRMVLQRQSPEAGTGQVEQGRRGTRVGVTAVAGSGLGVMTGFFGVGGGFLIVPALTLIIKLPMHLAVGTSIVVIFLNSLAGLGGHLGFGSIQLDTALPFLAGAMAGTLFGSRLTGVIGEALHRRAFAILLLTVGVLVMVQSLD